MTCVEFFAKVLRLPLTVGQTAFVAVVVDGRLPRELEGEIREAAIEIFGDVDHVPDLARRTVVAAMGRDSGKTQLGAGIGLYLLVTCDLSGVGPGDIATVAIVAPREKTARIALRRAVALVQRAPELRRLLVGAPRKDGFTLKRPDGHAVAFEVFAASRGGASLRGPSFIAVIFDEAAQFRDESAAVNDAELYSAVMPRVLRLALFLSTPWSEEGLFYSLANTNFGAPSSALVAIASTLVMRDHDPLRVASVAAETARDSENATREFVLAGLASFMATGGSTFFDGRAIEEAIDDALILPATLVQGELVGFGADVGLVRDSSAIVGCGALGRGSESRLRVLQLREMRPEKNQPLKLSEVVHAFAEECRRFGARSFLADGHSREPAREWADVEKIRIEPRPEGPTAKFDTHVAVREALRDRRLALPRHPRLLGQLRAITMKPVPGGTYRITSPRRIGQAHGDLAAALVLAVHAALEGGAGLSFREVQARIHGRRMVNPERAGDLRDYGDARGRRGMRGF